MPFSACHIKSMSDQFFRLISSCGVDSGSGVSSEGFWGKTAGGHVARWNAAILWRVRLLLSEPFWGVEGCGCCKCLGERCQVWDHHMGRWTHMLFKYMSGGWGESTTEQHLPWCVMCKCRLMMMMKIRWLIHFPFIGKVQATFCL